MSLYKSHGNVWDSVTLLIKDGIYNYVVETSPLKTSVDVYNSFNIFTNDSCLKVNYSSLGVNGLYVPQRHFVIDNFSRSILPTKVV